MRMKLIGLMAVAAMLGCSGSAIAAATGVAKGVDPQAEALAKGVTKTLTVGADVFIGDKITTGQNGLVQIVFADDTKLAIGPNSSLVIDDYLVRNNGSAGKFAIDVLGGSFRFITGTSPKNAYEIKTPTGTIGVRGTFFDGWVDPETGIVWVTMYRGTTELRSEKEQKLLSGLCYVGTIDLDEAKVFGSSAGIEGDDRDEYKSRFIFSVDQSKLLPEFKLTAAAECTRNKPTTSGDNESIGGGGYAPEDAFGSLSAEEYALYGEGARNTY